MSFVEGKNIIVNVHFEIKILCVSDVKQPDGTKV